MQATAFLAHQRAYISPSAIDPIRREANRLHTDQVLLSTLISELADRVTDRTERPVGQLTVAVPAGTYLGHWVEVYLKAINHAAFRHWARSQYLDLATLGVHGSHLQATQNNAGVKQTAHFSLSDNTGWRHVAEPIISALQVLDTGQAGVRYVPARAGQHEVKLSLDLVLAFYGYPTPVNRWQAQVILDELMTLRSFPAIDDSGRIKSTVREKLAEEQRDYRQLADELQAILDDGHEFRWLHVYGRRLNLRSDSMLSMSLKAAAAILEGVVESEEFLSLNPEDAKLPSAYHYSFSEQAIVSVNTKRTLHTKPADRTEDNVLNRQWDELVRLSGLLQMDIQADASLSLAALMNAYRLLRPASATDAQAQVDQLRAYRAVEMPYVNSASHSLAIANQHLQHIAILNDRYRAREGLATMTDDSRIGPALAALLEPDPDSPFKPLIDSAAQQLRQLSRDPAFTRLAQEHDLDVERLLWIDAEGRLTGLDQEAKPKTLPVALDQIKALSTKVAPLLQRLKQTGGRIGTDTRVSLQQLLELYQLDIPVTARQAKAIDRLLAIPLPRSPLNGNYWNALQVAPLLPNQRQQVLQTVQAFLPSSGETLLDYLSQAFIEPITLNDVRAQADLLLGQVLASPRAQRLADRLSQAVPWHGVHATSSSTRASRNELLLAALILSLDPEAGQKKACILGIDLASPHMWGLSFTEVRSVVDATVRMRLLHAGTVPLATHVLLAGVAPEFLVQDISDDLPYMSSQTWVHFKQFVDSIEHDNPGGTRAMRFTDFLALIHFTVPGNPHRRSREPIIDWAVANGVLPRSDKADSPDDTNRAIGALNEQLSVLRSSAQTLEAPQISARQVALEALSALFPQNRQLDTPLFWWQPEGARTAQSPAPGLSQQQRFSLVDLHLAGRLQHDPGNWRSLDTAINYPQMTLSFLQLKPHHLVFADVFKARLEAVRTAHLVSIRYWLSQLSVYSREALASGALDFFSLRQADATQPARFGILVYCYYPGHSRAYEFFPKRLAIRGRPDLPLKALLKPNRTSLLAVDWPAYETGALLVRNAPVALIAHRFAQLPALPGPGVTVPYTFAAVRSQELATLLVDQHLLTGSSELQERAKQPMSLKDAINRHDPWAAFIAEVIPMRMQ